MLRAWVSSPAARPTADLTWTPVAIPNTAGMVSPDKNWIVCDNTATSPFYGNCYTEWDDNGAGNRMEMSSSTDGGVTWSVAATNNNGIIGGQPVVRPDGTVIVPTANANETAIGAFNSTNGGVSWSATTTIATIRHHGVAGSLREGPLPSAEIDGAGTVYIVWADSRFRTGGKVNDIVITHSLNADRHELVRSDTHPDRCYQQRDRSLHPGPGSQQIHFGRYRTTWPDVLFLPKGKYPTECWFHFLSECGQHLEHATDRDQRNEIDLGQPLPVRAAWWVTTSQHPTVRIIWRTEFSAQRIRQPPEQQPTVPPALSITVVRRSIPSLQVWPAALSPG